MENMKATWLIDSTNNAKELISVIIRKDQEAELDFLYAICTARHSMESPPIDHYGNTDRFISDKKFSISVIEKYLSELSHTDFEFTLTRLNEILHKEDTPGFNSKDIRLAKFIENIINHKKIHMPVLLTFSLENKWGLDWHRNFILQLNLKTLTRNQKIQIIKQINQTWNESKLFDRKLKWYNSDTKNKIETTWLWFCKKHPKLTSNIDPPKTIADIKIIFDLLITNNTLKENYLNSIKDSKKNRKYYEKAKNKPIVIESVEMPPIKKLLKMEAAERDISQQRLIEILFITAANNNLLSEKTMNFIKENYVLKIDSTYGKEMRNHAFKGALIFGKK